jgi:O-antigen/teichoic acid export membrane protein
MSRYSPSFTSVLRGGGSVLAGLVMWNLGNYAFFLVAGRTLGPREYGLVAALLAATVLVAVPATSLQLAAARLVAAPPGGDAELAEGIYRRAWRRGAVIAPVVALVAGATIIVVDSTLRSVPVGPLLMVVALVLPLGFFFLALGRLQGEARFGAFSLCFALWGAPRPVVLVPLAMIGLGTYAALGATGAAVSAALGASVWFTRRGRPAREPSPSEWRAFARPLVPVVVGLAGLGVLTNLDVIVAKVVLTADTAGQFAAAATMAKAVYLVPQAVSLVLLPRVAAWSAAAQDTGMLIGLGVGVTLGIGGVASLVIWVIAEPLLRITYGSDFTGSAGLLAAYAGASTLVGALIVLINHHVGRGADRFVWGTACIAALQALLFMAFHGSQRSIVTVDAAAAGIGLLLHECMFFGTGEAIVPGLVRAIRRGRQLRHEVV